MWLLLTSCNGSSSIGVVKVLLLTGTLVELLLLLVILLVLIMLRIESERLDVEHLAIKSTKSTFSFPRHIINIYL
jgi:hypothetical protein